MSLTLGEKLRQARESRGISISEVAEQTRISALYLESIENNDYRGLPGGIFNKGFVKSYAKYVGIDDQEALQDYARLISEQGEDKIDETKTYKPEVLTDDRSTGSMLPTLVFAAIILGLGAWGIISLVNWLNTPKEPVVANTNTANANKPSNSNSNSNTNTAPQTMPAVNEIKVEIKTSGEPIPLTYSIDDQKGLINATVTTEKPLSLNPQNRVSFNYYRTFGKLVQLTVNGKVITAPDAPIPPKKNAIEYEINKENIQQIWQSGAITTAAPPNANTANTAPR
jgi:cytoskeletal protein RodZ